MRVRWVGVAALLTVVVSCDANAARAPVRKETDVPSVPTTSPSRPIISESERAEILAAATLARLGQGMPSHADIRVVHLVGRATSDGFIQPGSQSTPLTDSEQQAIRDALPTQTVRFIDPPKYEELVDPQGNAEFTVVNLAAPEETQGRIVVVATAWCGMLCGTGGAFTVERGDTGAWHVIGPFGPQWEA
jgi:hypothetical protein